MEASLATPTDTMVDQAIEAAPRKTPTAEQIHDAQKHTAKLVARAALEKAGYDLDNPEVPN